MKLDVQGYEKKVLDGTGDALGRVCGVQLEMSLRPLYRGEVPIKRMLRYMKRLGFRLSSLEYGFTHPKTGEMLQVDGIFFRDT